MPNRPSRSIVAVVALLAIGFASVGHAQVITERQGSGVRPGSQPASRDRSNATTIDVQLLVGKEGVGLQSQRWLRVFEKLEIPLTVRQGDIGDKPALSEKSSGGGARRVELVGRLDRTGRITFPDRSFTEADADKLAVWLTELREFGALGAPAGKPVWGLSNQQFDRLFRGLTAPVRDELQGLPLADAIAAFDLPEAFPLSFSDSAARRIEAAGPGATVRGEFKGIAGGTALAALLNESGLGFRPQRSRSGALQITVVTLDEASDVWPVGWPPTKKAADTAPSLFKLLPIELEDIELDAVLDGVAEISKVPVLVDRHGLKSRQIDLANTRVSHPRRHVSYNTMLKTVTGLARLQHEVRIDEAGRPLVWVFALGSRRESPAP